MIEEDQERLAGELSECFGEQVSVHPIHEGQQTGVSLLVCTMSYWRRTADNSGPRRQIQQTVVVLEADDLNLPQFALSPHAKGLLGKVFDVLGGFGDINFDDSPEFSAKYHLHGWAEEPVRILFTAELRNHFSADHGWGVRGNRKRLIVFRHNEVVPQSQLDEFVASALKILSLLRRGEQELDARPDVVRETSGQDILNTADQMGFAGAMLARQLRGLSLTTDELSAFHSAGEPRPIPSGMKRQVLGDNLPLVFIGLLFLVAGFVAGGITLAVAPEKEKWIGMLFLIIFPVVGGLMAGLTIRYRRRKARLLRLGIMTTGVISRVHRTSTMINGQVQHKVTVAYSSEGQNRSTTCNAYGAAAEKARGKGESGSSVTVLIDPNDVEHVLCTDLLMLFDK